MIILLLLLLLVAAATVSTSFRLVEEFIMSEEGSSAELSKDSISGHR